MIPKKIHYCWFGKGKKNKLFYKCLKSWKKYFPDFEIIEWNEDNFDINSNRYMKEAYDAKKWAFVSDYARLKILYDNGGIYFDTDVEVLKRIDDSILESGYFAKEKDTEIATGLGFAVYPHNSALKCMMDDYENISFYLKDNSFDLTACPIRNTESLLKNGYIIDVNCFDIGGVKVFDKNYFCGFDLETNNYIISSKTFTVHHYTASWLPFHRRVIKKVKKIISKIIGKNNYQKIRNIKKMIRK